MFAQRIYQNIGLFTRTRNTLCVKNDELLRNFVFKVNSAFHTNSDAKTPLIVRAPLKDSFQKSFFTALLTHSRFWPLCGRQNHTPHKCQSTQMGKRREKITQNINIELIDKVIPLNIHTSWKSHCCLVEGSLFWGKSCNIWKQFASTIQHTHSTDIETLFTDNHHNYVSLSWKDLREKRFRLMCTVFYASDNRKINYHEKLFRLSLTSETRQRNNDQSS